jgi:transcriptional regulator with XRE-family HTH domain
VKLRRHLAQVRREQKVTGRELAHRLDTTPPSITNMETRRSALQLDTLEQWAAALGLRVRILLVAIEPPGGEDRG